jgi:thymidylate kinase
MKTKYVEFVGVAGSGKTTALDIFIEEANKINMPTQARKIVGKNTQFRFQIILKIIIICFLVPEIFSLYFINLRNDFKNTPHVNKIKRNLITRMIIDTAVIYCMLQKSSNLVVNDEGLIGKLISLSIIAEISSSKIYKLIKKLLPKYTILTYVNTLPLTALTREKERKIDLPFFDDMDYKLKEKFFHQAVKMYKSLPKKLVKISNIREFSISNSSNYNQLTAEVSTLTKNINKLILHNKIRDV